MLAWWGIVLGVVNAPYYANMVRYYAIYGGYAIGSFQII